MFLEFLVFMHMHKEHLRWYNNTTYSSKIANVVATGVLCTWSLFLFSGVITVASASTSYETCGSLTDK